jgi:outer membrane protein assembly factor BamB
MPARTAVSHRPFRPHLVRGALALALAAALAGCSDDEEPPLEGDRMALRQQDAAGAAPTVAESRPIPREAPLSDWTQLNGDAARSAGQDGGAPDQGISAGIGTGNISAPATLAQAWRVDIGSEFEALAPGQPIVVDGRLFVRDGESGLTALDAGSGAEIWRADLTLEDEDEETGFGGGVAFDDGRLYATTGFGEVLALDPATGEILWRKRFDAPFRVAPAATGGRVFAVNRANVAFALTGATGDLQWRIDGASARPGNLAGAPPASLRSVAALPFGSGELALARASRGLRLWSVNLSSSGSGEGLSAFPDVTSAPVISGTDIFAGNAAGRLVGIDGRIGQVRWSRQFGALSPVWVAGDTLFVATTEPALTRLDKMTGATLWRAPLEAWEDPEDREGPIVYHGPVLAGGRLLTASSDGRLLIHDPVTGEMTNAVELPSGVRSGPVVAGGTVYLLTDAGEVIALR